MQDLERRSILKHDGSSQNPSLEHVRAAPDRYCVSAAQLQVHSFLHHGDNLHWLRQTKAKRPYRNRRDCVQTQTEADHLSLFTIRTAFTQTLRWPSAGTRFQALQSKDKKSVAPGPSLAKMVGYEESEIWSSYCPWPLVSQGRELMHGDQNLDTEGAPE